MTFLVSGKKKYIDVKQMLIKTNYKTFAFYPFFTSLKTVF